MNVLNESPLPPVDRKPPLDREWTTDREIDVFGGLMFLWRHRYGLLLGLLAGVAIGWAVTLTTAKEYSAAASVIVPPVTRGSLLATSTLTIDSIDQLAMSQVVRGQVNAELGRRQASAGGEIRGFRTLVQRSADPARPSVSILNLTTVATSPELARDASNVWADVLAAATNKLEASLRGETSQLVKDEYPKAAEHLIKQERALEEIRRSHQAAMQDARVRAAISLKEAELSSQERLVVEMEEQRKRLVLALKESEAGVAALEEELKQVPQVVLAMGDSAPNAAARGGTGGSDGSSRSRPQEMNPLYTTLAGKLADARVRRRELSAKQAGLDAQIEELRRGAHDSRAALAAAELSLANLELRQETEVFAKEREVSIARLTFDKLEQGVGDAQIVDALMEPTLKPGVAAELPTASSGPERLPKLAIGAVGGLAFALFVSWFLDTARRRGIRLA